MVSDSGKRVHPTHLSSLAITPKELMIPITIETKAGLQSFSNATLVQDYGAESPCGIQSAREYDPQLCKKDYTRVYATQ